MCAFSSSTKVHIHPAEYQTIATPDQPIVTVLGDQPDDTVLQPLEDEEAARKQDASGSAYPSEYPFQDSQDGSESEYEEYEIWF